MQMSVLENTKKEIKIEKSLCKILDLEFIPNHQFIVNERENCVTIKEIRCLEQLCLYGKNNYGYFYKINNYDIHCVKLKIQINHSQDNNGYGMYFGVTESNYNVTCKNVYITADKGKKGNKTTKTMFVSNKWKSNDTHKT